MLANLFKSLFFLNDIPHEIMEMPRLSRAINAANPCIKPTVVCGNAGTSVGNMAAKKIPTQKTPSVILAVRGALTCSIKPINSRVDAMASAKKAIVISQLSLPTAYSLTKEVSMFLSGLKKCKKITIVTKRIKPYKLIKAFVFIGFIQNYFVKMSDINKSGILNALLRLFFYQNK